MYRTVRIGVVTYHAAISRRVRVSYNGVLDASLLTTGPGGGQTVCTGNFRFAACGFLVVTTISKAQTFRPEIPKAWDDWEVARFEVPLAQRDRSPLNAAEYYALEVAPIYRAYPVYVPGKGPAGYLETLKAKDPEIVFDSAKLRTEQDWICAGELVFDSPTRLASFERVNIIRPEFLRAVPLKTTRDGVPFD
jgi:hypothetical protein